MEQRNQEEIDQEIMNTIKNLSEDIEVPKTLEPENMMNRIMQKKKRKHNKIIKNVTMVLAASLALAVGIANIRNITLMDGKSKSISGNIDSIKGFESYDDIYEIMEQNIKKNNFYYTDDMIFNATIKNEGSVSENDFTDTNIQVEGVSESDVIKTDGSYIYIFNRIEATLSIVKADKENTKLVSSTDIGENVNDIYIGEIYLDGTKLSIVYSDGEKTYLDTFDISDKTLPKLLGNIDIAGDYYSSRKTDKYIYLFTQYYPEDGRDIPEINNSKISCEDIFEGNCEEYGSYVNIVSVNIEKPEKAISKKSVITNLDRVYVSADNIYVFGINTEKNTTGIIKFNYNDGKLRAAANGEIDGVIKDNFAIDEHKGYLRVLTTKEIKNSNNYYEYEESIADMIVDTSRNSSNNVYILDSNLQVTGSVENLVRDERIYSARYQGDMAYFVTYRETDPVFSVDLSNPQNPKVIGELKITGFSEYLHFWSDDLMLGLGKEDNKIKLSMYDISDPENVVEINKMILNDTNYSSALYEYRAVLINPEKNIVGFNLEKDMELYTDSNEWDGTEFSYNTYSYDEENGFTETSNTSIETYYDFSEVRGININDSLYVVEPEGTINIYDMNGYKKLTQLSL